MQFTLGSLKKIADDANFKLIENAFIEKYFKPSFDLQLFGTDVMSIKSQYRDKVAHKEGISIYDAKKCREDMIEIKKIFIFFLENIKE